MSAVGKFVTRKNTWFDESLQRDAEIFSAINNRLKCHIDADEFETISVEKLPPLNP